MIDNSDKVAAYFRRSCEALDRAAGDPALREAIDGIAGAITRAFRNGAKLLIAGNGGSAADAQHIAGELLSRFGFDRNPLPAIALTTDTSILTAIGNDYGYDRTFERQVRGLGRPGDVFLALSTSGRSPNVLLALKAARDLGITTIGFHRRWPPGDVGLLRHLPRGAVRRNAGDPTDPHRRRACDLRDRRARAVRRRVGQGR